MYKDDERDSDALFPLLQPALPPLDTGNESVFGFMCCDCIEVVQVFWLGLLLGRCITTNIDATLQIYSSVRTLTESAACGPRNSKNRQNESIHAQSTNS